MKCFDVVRLVLDETYNEIRGDETTKDKKINSSMTAMSKQYTDHLMESGGPDFSDPITRFSYVMRYVPAHAH
jgi:predicted glycosyltransferase